MFHKSHILILVFGFDNILLVMLVFIHLGWYINTAITDEELLFGQLFGLESHKSTSILVMISFGPYVYS
jgi:hypothetical protein